MVSNRTKKLVKRHLPSGVLAAIQAVRSRWHTPDPQIAQLFSSFVQMNQGLAAERIAMRPGIEFSIHAESREPFQYFCWKSPQMVREYDCFMQMRQTAATFLDVGANHGVYSLAFSHGRPDGRVLAIEPSHLAFPILIDNISRNSPCSVECIQIAASDKEETLRMRVNWHHLEMVAEESRQMDTSRVPARPLDALCEERKFVPDLVKVDVEGCELRCLRGLRHLLLTRRPPVFLEIHPELIYSLGYCETDIVRFVDEVDYHFEDVSGGRLSGTFIEDQIHTNWVILRPN